ncbi:MAG: hypothetical protein IPP52_08165 [Ignavibacteria bacterium]|nr:hypothetical protein [Ignavibacteria bacterium]
MKMALMNEAGEEGTQRLMKLIRNWVYLIMAHSIQYFKYRKMLAAQKNPKV